MAYYEKVLLYAYPQLLKLTEQIDDLVLKRALGSFSCYDSCLEQAEAIMDMTLQKQNLLSLKVRLDEILKKHFENDMIYLEYKYFKRLKKEAYQNFDASSRGYFRKQLKLAEKFSSLIKADGMTEKWFFETFSNSEFMMRLLARVTEYETSGRIIKAKKKEKTTLKVPIKKSA